MAGSQGPHAEGLQKLKLPAGEGIVGWVALHRRPLMVNDPDHDARHDLFIPEKIGVPARNILAVPLMPAPAVVLSAGSIRMRLPVARLSR